MKHILIAAAIENDQRRDNEDALVCARNISDMFSSDCAYSFSMVTIRSEDFNSSGAIIKKVQPDGVLNLFEGFNDCPEKEAEFVSQLEKENIRFTGNGSETLALCIDKDKCKKKLLSHGISVPEGISVYDGDIPDLDGIIYPVFVKPLKEDASVGIDRSSFCKNRKSLELVLSEKIRKYPKGVLVERFMPGVEYSLSFIGHNPYKLLAVSSIDYSMLPENTPFMTYSSKWDTHDPDYSAVTPAIMKNVDHSIYDKIVMPASRAGQAAGCRGYFRVDMRADSEGNIYVIDINPNPCISCDSGFIRQAEEAGYSYKEIIVKILEEAGV